MLASQVLNGPRCGQRWTVRSLAALGFALVPGMADTSSATTPSYRQKNAVSNASSMSGVHDLDINNPGDSPFSSVLGGVTYSSGAALLSPYAGSGHAMAIGSASSNAKGGAGHSEGSNLAKITFPSGMGVDQTDASHLIGASLAQYNFNFKWELPSGAFGATNTTFSIPVGAKVGTGAGAFAKVAYDINWSKVVDGGGTTLLRNFSGELNFNSPGTYLTSITAPAVSTPAISGGGGDDFVFMHGAIQFFANNDDTPSVIELMGEGQGPQKAEIPDSVSPLLRNDLDFLTLWNQNPDLHYEPATGFEPPVPEPSAALLAAGAGSLLLARRRRADRVNAG
jgi:hypothetical protein